MFVRALQCFQKQRYENRELVVMFENDPVTEQFIAGNEEFNYVELIDSPEVVLLAHEPEEPNSRSLRLELPDRECHPENISAALLQLIDAGTSWNMSAENGNCFLLHAASGWLAKDHSNQFYLVTNVADATRFEKVRDLDSRWLLVASSREGDAVSRIGWVKRFFRFDPSQRITFYKINTRKKLTLGMKRNLAIRVASGDFIAVWDDDDWYSEWRLFNQMRFLEYTGKRACALACTVFYDHNNRRVYLNLLRVTGHENTLLFRKSDISYYDNLNTGEDTPLLLSFYNVNQLAVMDDPYLYIYNFHRKNSCSDKHFNIIISTSTPLPEEVRVWADRMLAGYIRQEHFYQTE